MTEPLTYAVGDIHGCADLLRDLLERIDDHAAGRPRKLVFLGDYVDRGPDSAGVLDILRGLRHREPERVVCLMGNHEAMLLAALAEPGGAEHWLANGGEETLDSFGTSEPASIPRDVLDWIEALPSLHMDRLRWYVHAGFRPGGDIPDPSTHNRLWIREPFLSADVDFGRHVVHGHTPRRDGRPEVRPFRTNLDTAAVYGGALTAGVFDEVSGPPVDFVSVKARAPGG